MISLQEVERQLKQIGTNFRFVGRSSIKELQHILVPNEQIQGCINGRYSGGFAVLCSTDMRLLLIDKKPLYLTVEDIRYDMIVEVDYNHQLLDATIHVYTPNKTLRFSSFKQKELRSMTSYIQQRVMEFRQQHMMSQGEPPLPQINQEVPQTTLPINSNYPLTQPQIGIASNSQQPQDRMGASRLPEISLPKAINPYIKSPFTLRRRISRFHKENLTGNQQ